MLKISEIESRGNSISFKDCGSKSTYAFITGDNGSGKSEFLCSTLESLGITSVYSRRRKDRSPAIIQKNSFPPRKIITLSLTPFSKISSYSTNKNRDIIAYTHIGSDSSSRYALFFQAAVEYTKLQKGKAWELIDRIGAATGILPRFKAEISVQRNRSLSARLTKEVSALDVLSSALKFKLIEKSSFLLEFSPGTMLIDEQELDENGSDLILQDILLLRRYGAIAIRSIKLNLQSGQEIDISYLSSGQISLFIAITILATTIEDNSIVLIDEPEISLHPAWQSMFTEMLYTIGEKRSYCHFIIATHSPIILSAARRENSEIFNFTNKIPIPENKHKQGIEEIYADHFDVITPNNFFIKNLIIKAANALQRENREEILLYKKTLEAILARDSKNENSELINAILEKINDN
jgi:predicted ATPase